MRNKPKKAKDYIFLAAVVTVSVIASALMRPIFGNIHWDLTILPKMFLGMILLILFPLLVFYYFSKKKMEDFGDIFIVTFLSISITGILENYIRDAASGVGSSVAQFLIWLGLVAGVFLLILGYIFLFHWGLGSKMGVGRKEKSKKVNVKKLLRKYGPVARDVTIVVAAVATIVSAIVVGLTAWSVKTYIEKTEPELRTSYFFATLMENGRGNSSGGNDNIFMEYFNAENIEYLDIRTKVVNIGSGVAYGADIRFTLPGLKYYQPENGAWIKGYVGSEEAFSYSGNLENTIFGFGQITLSPQGGDEAFRLIIPFKGVGSIDNLPSACVLTVKDITGTTLLEKTVTFSYIQSE